MMNVLVSFEKPILYAVEVEPLEDAGLLSCCRGSGCCWGVVSCCNGV